MSEITVVMLGHKSLAGKDTIFDFAKDLGFQRVAFADSLKHSCMQLFDLSYDQVFSEGKDVMDERFPNTRDSKLLIKTSTTDSERGQPQSPNPDYKPFLTPRRILQLYGQDCRSLFNNVWASYIFTNTIPKLVEEGHKRIIVTDFRFQNEATVAKNWADETGNTLLMYKVHRPGVSAKTGAGDISENDLNDFTNWTGEIVNDSSLTALKEKTLNIFSSI